MKQEKRIIQKIVGAALFFTLIESTAWATDADSGKAPEQETVYPALDAAASVFKEIGNDQATKDRMEAIHSNISTTDEEVYDSYMAGDFDSEISRSERTGQVSQGAKDVLKGQLAKELSKIGVLKNGFSFDFDLANIFSAPAQAPSKRDTVRYGLHVSQIEPPTRKLLMVNNEINGNDIINAPKSKVNWRIAPIESNKSLYKVSEPSTSAYEGYNYPSTKVKANLTPAVMEKEPEDQGGPAKAGFKASLFQEEQLYRVEYNSVPQVENDNIRHGVSIPVKGEMKLDREMDKGFTPLKTSIKNILGASEGPSSAEVNVHYINQEDRYQSELGYEKDGWQTNFKATSKGQEEGQNESYEWGLSTDF